MTRHSSITLVPFALAYLCVPSVTGQRTLYADGFERPVIGWTIARQIGAKPTAKIEAKVPVGFARDRALRVDFASWGETAFASPLFLAPRGPTVYSLAVSARSNDPAAMRLHLELRDTKGRGIALADVNFPARSPSSAAVFSFPTHSVATSGKVRAYLHVATLRRGSVWIDDVSISTVSGGPVTSMLPSSPAVHLLGLSQASSKFHLYLLATSKLPNPMSVPGIQGLVAVDPRSLFLAAWHTAGSGGSVLGLPGFFRDLGTAVHCQILELTPAKKLRIGNLVSFRFQR